jgi:flagellar protein FliL
MIRKLFPILLALLGLGGGIGAGVFLRPPPEPDEHAETEEGEHAEGEAKEAGAEEGEPEEGGAEEGGPEYVKMNNQFIVPVVEKGRVAAMVVLSLSIEVEPGNTEAVYQREPKLRDVFLQVLFDHANVGGFSGSFTDGSNLVVLRTSLRESAVEVLGDALRDVLITDIARQDS